MAGRFTVARHHVTADACLRYPDRYSDEELEFLRKIMCKETVTAIERSELAWLRTRLPGF